MIFKKKMIECFKCKKEYPDSYEACPLCYPSDIEMTPVNITIMIIIMIVLGYAILNMF